MKFCIRIALSMCMAALFATPASACWLFPFGGWWGAGYYGSPAYTAPAYSSYYSAPSYTSFYGAFSAPSFGCCGNAAPVYAASYGSFGSYDSGCCVNSCCQSCSGSGCASGSCVGSTPAGTLKPAQDPISDKKAPAYEDDTRSRRFDPESRSPRTPATDDVLDPVNDKDRYDRFERERPGTRDSEPANPGTGTDGSRNPGMFDDGNDPRTERLNQKPEMPDVLDDKETEPANPAEPDLGSEVDEKTFYEDKSNRDNTTSLSRDAVVARSSSLSEVIAPKRLASRSLPSGQQSAARSTLADKSSNSQSDVPRPVRWISAPMADGHVQL